MANRDVTVKLTELGSDIENISIYKSSFIDANYIASVSRAVLMGDGYTFSVDDQVSKFLLYSGEPCNTTLELNLPSPTTTTTTSAGTTTTSTTTTAAPTTTTTTPQPSPTDKSYQLNIINSTTGGAVISGATTITLTGPPNSSRTHTNVISAANGYTTPNTITATSPQAEITPQLNGTTSSTSRTLTSTVVIPANGGNGQVTIYGNFTQTTTTTTTTAAPTTTTTTAAPTTTTTTLAPASTRFYHANQNSITGMASSSNPTAVTLWRAGGTNVGVGTQLYTSDTLTNANKATSVVYGDWIGMEYAGGSTTFNGIYNATNNINAPTMSGGDKLVKINATGVIIEMYDSLVYMGLYEGTSCADAFTATTSSGVSNHYLGTGSFATGVNNYGTGLSNGNYYARYVGSNLEVAQYTAGVNGAVKGTLNMVSSAYSCP